MLFYATRSTSEKGQRLSGWHQTGIDICLVLFLAFISRIVIFPNLNTAAWAMMDLIAIFLLSQKTNLYSDIFRKNMLLLFWPIMAIISSLWSINFQVTFYHSIQFFMNAVVALTFARVLGLERFIWILFLFGSIFLTGSLVFGLITPAITLDDAGNFKGLFIHKNELGMFSTIQLMISVVLFFHKHQRFLSVIGFLIAAATLVKSGSGTSLLLSISIMTMIPFFILVRRGLFAAGQVFGISVALISGVLIFILGSGFSIIDFVLSSLGKDPSLTGRDLIWKIAVDAIEARPLLGHGFLAYWMSGESTAGYLRYVLKQDLVAFHNVYLEMTVAFGVFGLLIFISGLLYSLWRSFQFFIFNQSFLAITPMLFIVWISLLSMTENPFFWNSQLHFIFMCFAGFSSVNNSIWAWSISEGARSQ